MVVNDSLVLVTFLNRLCEQGHTLREAALLAGPRRFRPIPITSATTFAGLVPIMLEQSAQAQFVIPMAISLGYGVVVATVFTLLFVPAAIVVVEDFKLWTADLKRRVFSIVEEHAPQLR